MKKVATLSKEEQITIWIQKMKRSTSKVLVSSYCYDCLFSGDPREKTLITFPDELEEKGVITIHKPLKQVELIDIIQLYSRINKS